MKFFDVCHYGVVAKGLIKMDLMIDMKAFKHKECFSFDIALDCSGLKIDIESITYGINRSMKFGNEHGIRTRSDTIHT